MFEILNIPVPEFLGMNREWTDVATFVYSATVTTAHEITFSPSGVEVEVYNDQGTLIFSYPGDPPGTIPYVKVPVATGTASIRFRTKVRNDISLDDKRIGLGIDLGSGGTGNNIKEVSNWDKAKLRSLNLDYARNLVTVPSKISPNLWTITFIGATILDHSNISLWDTGNLRTIAYMFANCAQFNQPLNGWNTSNVTAMDYMFSGCAKFNQSISNWNVSKVTSLQNMFSACKVYNQNLSNMIFKSTAVRTNYDAGTTAWLTQNKPKFTGT